MYETIPTNNIPRSNLKARARAVDLTGASPPEKQAKVLNRRTIPRRA